MGEAKRRRRHLASTAAPCIFCGGQRPATTEEHCPPRALFVNRAWPEGFVFPACTQCNGGSSQDDLWVAFLAHLDGEPAKLHKGVGLMQQLKRQDPIALRKMFGISAVDARAAARRLRLSRPPGQTYQQLGVVKVPEAGHRAVGTLADKLSKALYFKSTGQVFPSDGGIAFHWFTNAQIHEFGEIPALEAMRAISAVKQPVGRNGQDLSGQFECRYSMDAEGGLHLLQVTFGKVFGFVSIFSPQRGRIEALMGTLEQHLGTTRSPFTFVTSSDPARLAHPEISAANRSASASSS